MKLAARADHEFAMAVRDELYVRGTLVETRLSHGAAQRLRGSMAATDVRDEELVSRCEAELRNLRADIALDARVRIVSTARRVAGRVSAEATMTITMAGVSIVSRDAALLRDLLATDRRPAAAGAPIVWWNGSAAVLLHEAVGHPAEHRAPPVGWPPWLSVRDEPSFEVDDRGSPARSTDLLVEPPASFRCESFRNVPLQRMSNLVASQSGAPFELPEQRVDVFLVAGGSYDPLTDLVTLDIAVSSRGVFTIRRTREEIAASLAGATGGPLSYPGVICSREGQEIVVGSSAPVMVTL